MINIDELAIRYPGLGVEEGRSLGGLVAQKVSQRLASGVSTRSLGSLEISIEVNGEMTASELAEVIAEKIIGQIKITLL